MYSAFISGALALLGFYVCLLYFQSRSRIYLYYFLFLLFNLLGIVVNLGNYHWNETLEYYISHSASRKLEVFTLLAFSFYGVFAIQLLDLKKQQPVLSHCIMYFASATALYAVLYGLFYPLIQEQAFVYFVSSRVLILSLSLVAIFWIMRSVRSAFKGFFIIGTCFYFIGAALSNLESILPNLSFQILHKLSPSAYYELGIFLEMICFSLALTKRIRIRNNNKRKEMYVLHEKAVYERDLAYSQMLASRVQVNPHFIFNCLNSIEYLIHIHDNAKATKYLNAFSRFVRLVLDTGQKPLISMADELDIVRLYLLLEANRFNEQFSYDIEIAPDVDLRGIELPPLFLQPIVEDSIWRGLLSSPETDKKLRIGIERHDDKVVVEIEDNGSRKNNRPLGKSERFHQTFGRTLFQERVDLHNKTHPLKIHYEPDKKNRRNEPTRKTCTRVIIDT